MTIVTLPFGPGFGCLGGEVTFSHLIALFEWDSGGPENGWPTVRFVWCNVQGLGDDLTTKKSNKKLKQGTNGGTGRDRLGPSRGSGKRRHALHIYSLVPQPGPWHPEFVVAAPGPWVFICPRQMGNCHKTIPLHRVLLHTPDVGLTR